jgi:hypothetical protein
MGEVPPRPAADRDDKAGDAARRILESRSDLGRIPACLEGKIARDADDVCVVGKQIRHTE